MKDNIELICDIAERIAFAGEGEDRGRVASGGGFFDCRAYGSRCVFNLHL